MPQSFFCVDQFAGDLGDDLVFAGNDLAQALDFFSQIALGRVALALEQGRQVGENQLLPAIEQVGGDAVFFGQIGHRHAVYEMTPDDGGLLF